VVCDDDETRVIIASARHEGVGAGRRSRGVADAIRRTNGALRNAARFLAEASPRRRRRA